MESKPTQGMKQSYDDKKHMYTILDMILLEDENARQNQGRQNPGECIPCIWGYIRYNIFCRKFLTLFALVSCLCLLIQ